MMPRLTYVLLFAALPALNAAAQEPPPVPDAIKVPLGHVLKFSAHAEGFQIYQCGQDKTDPKLYAWTLTGPQANLFDAQGSRVGRHYAGPTWEGMDGSKIVGQAKANSPSPESNSVAWLLLETKPAGGTGIMNGVTLVQRLQTHGGKSPKDGCNEKTAGTNVNAPYSAMYYFFEAK